MFLDPSSTMISTIFNPAFDHVTSTLTTSPFALKLNLKSFTSNYNTSLIYEQTNRFPIHLKRKKISFDV